jgi:hypothetical protein
MASSFVSVKMDLEPYKEESWPLVSIVPNCKISIFCKITTISIETWGGDHVSYVIVNDLEDGQKLKTNYEATHPPVPIEKEEEFKKKLDAEASRAERQDNLEWLTGTGRYGQ